MEKKDNPKLPNRRGGSVKTGAPSAPDPNIKAQPVEIKVSSSKAK